KPHHQQPRARLTKIGHGIGRVYQAFGPPPARLMGRNTGPSTRASRDACTPALRPGITLDPSWPTPPTRAPHPQPPTPPPPRPPRKLLPRPHRLAAGDRSARHLDRPPPLGQPQRLRRGRGLGTDGHERAAPAPPDAPGGGGPPPAAPAHRLGNRAPGLVSPEQ